MQRETATRWDWRACWTFKACPERQASLTGLQSGMIGSNELAEHTRCPSPLALYAGTHAPEWRAIFADGRHRTKHFCVSYPTTRLSAVKAPRCRGSAGNTVSLPCACASHLRHTSAVPKPREPMHAVAGWAALQGLKTSQQTPVSLYTCAMAGGVQCWQY